MGTRSRAINLRVTEDEYEVIQANATSNGMSVSSYVRSQSLNTTGSALWSSAPATAQQLTTATTTLESALGQMKALLESKE